MTNLSRRDFNKKLAAGLGAAALAAGSDRSDATPDKPNIVFICSDQHSYKYAGFAGHPIVKTPNLDRIAKKGTVFTNAYCGNPVCVPSRTSMMTGMYASDCESYCNSTVWDGSHPLWSKRLKDNGYHCWATGKLDLNDSFDSGFEEVDTKNGHQYKPDITSLFRSPVGYRIKERDGVDGQQRDHRNDDANKTRAALEFIQHESRELNKPWALYAGLHQPHPSFVALDDYFNQYYPNNVDMPNVPPGYLEDLHIVYQELRHFKRIATPIPEERIRRARAAYYGMITELDEYIGQILKSLEETNQLKNTIFIYTSDHGEALGEHGLWYKNNLFDVSARVPLVISGPGIPKGKQVNTPVGHVDLVATILEWGGLQKPKELRGHSLVPLMHGKKGGHPGYAFCETHSEGNCTGSFMIRKGDWKYIHFTWYDDMLFNLKNDPNELNNLINDPETADVQKELKSILSALVDTEKVTMNAFKAQEDILRKWSKIKSEEELKNEFISRLGEGQARFMARQVKERFAG